MVLDSCALGLVMSVYLYTYAPSLPPFHCPSYPPSPPPSLLHLGSWFIFALYMRANGSGVPPPGPRRCDCDPSGVSGDVCANGTCACKSNVEGERCDACVEGSFALRRDRLEGCKACVCSGHASSCMASADTAEVAVSSLQGWTLAPGGGTLTILDAGLELSAAAVPQAVRAPEAWLLPLRQAQDFAMLYFTLGTAPSPNPITPPTIQLAAGSRTFSYTPPPRLSQPSVFTVPILSPNDSSLWLGEGGGTTDATALQRALPSLSSLTLLLPARPCTALLSELRLGLWVRSLTLPLPLPLSPAPLQDQEQCTCPEPYNGDPPRACNCTTASTCLLSATASLFPARSRSLVPVLRRGLPSRHASAKPLHGLRPLRVQWPL